ncbi:hypothetical protein [Bacillus sp. FJAT-50079]|uniref:hypothetical protein n=1 Tax=Bacillus sp. FJAT-50079 TaxID=2833577 RepID=UPI001BCA6096|nr:hypothetical protein [Bacillus sp. FJAT-50079]MBS4208687.1 hypothetical protein [Bacillus sp. FJAT-50079]
MERNRNIEMERSVHKKGPRKLFQTLLLLYLLIFTVSQLYSPTGASFNDVTKIEGTILVDENFLNIGNVDAENVHKEDEDEQKEMSMDNEPTEIVDVEEVDIVDKLIEEHITEAAENQPDANQTERSESGDEIEDDVELD